MHRVPRVPTHRVSISILLFLLTLAAVSPASAADEDLAYDVEFFPGSAYDASIPTPEDLLGFRPGDRAAFPAEIEKCLQAWQASPRARLVEYARSHEGRALYYMVVTSPENLARIDEIQENVGKLADPRGLAAADVEGLIAGQPAIAWMAYSIHGDETSGTDASLAVLHHLLAGTGPEVTELLDQLVILVDPMQNPDGRHRFLQQIAEHRATRGNVDDQSLIHAGYLPWGRTNHYLFDLNRDWTLGVNPESRGRIAAAGSWHPQLMVDAHEMGAPGHLPVLARPGAEEPLSADAPGPVERRVRPRPVGGVRSQRLGVLHRGVERGLVSGVHRRLGRAARRGADPLRAGRLRRRRGPAGERRDRDLPPGGARPGGELDRQPHHVEGEPREHPARLPGGTARSGRRWAPPRRPDLRGAAERQRDADARLPRPDGAAVDRGSTSPPRIPRSEPASTSWGAGRPRPSFLPAPTWSRYVSPRPTWWRQCWTSIPGCPGSTWSASASRSCAPATRPSTTPPPGT